MTGARKDEITAILKEQIKGLKYDLEMQEVGVVVEVGDGIARVYGLESAMASEIVEFPNVVAPIAPPGVTCTNTSAGGIGGAMMRMSLSSPRAPPSSMAAT